jgi:hypothetical protein
MPIWITSPFTPRPGCAQYPDVNPPGHRPAQGPPAMATAPPRRQTYRPAQANAVLPPRNAKSGRAREHPQMSMGWTTWPTSTARRARTRTRELDQPRYQPASEPASTAPIARLQRRPLFAYSPVERHSTAPIAAVLPED